MMYGKYEFDPAVWEELKASISQDGGYPNCSIAENVRPCLQINEEGECVTPNPKISIDIMWDREIPAEFNSHEVFPNPIGVHTFAGQDYLYTQRFCQFHPDSPYCQIAE